jgi:hypothetical protein
MRLARPFCHHPLIPGYPRISQDIPGYPGLGSRSRVRIPSRDLGLGFDSRVRDFFHISNLTGRCIPTGHLIFRELREEGEELEIEFDF